DADTPGLGVRITKKGARAYVFESRLHGKTVRVTIGDVRSWQLGEARKEARRLATLIDRDIDPREERAKAQAQAEAERAEDELRSLQVSDAWSDYIEANQHRWGARHRHNHAKLAHLGNEKWRRGKGKTIPGPLAALLSLKLSDLTAERIVKWLQREKRTRATSVAQA